MNDSPQRRGGLARAAGMSADARAAQARAAALARWGRPRPASAPHRDSGGFFRIGQRVHKLGGYAFPGVVVARFRTLTGGRRYVVECTAPGAAGMLHIFRPGQLEADE